MDRLVHSCGSLAVSSLGFLARFIHAHDLIPIFSIGVADRENSRRA
jgi:hypothetical protein